jgi:hypothetical protein
MITDAPNHIHTFFSVSRKHDDTLFRNQYLLRIRARVFSLQLFAITLHVLSFSRKEVVEALLA